MTPLEEIAKRMDAREGATVVAFKEVALPVFRLNGLVTFQDAGMVGAIEEYLLRCIEEGISTSTELESFLGIPASIVTRQIAQSMHDGFVVQRSANPPNYALTKAGSERLVGALSTRIVRERMAVYVDGITRRIIPMDPSDAWSGSQVEQAALSPVVPCPRQSPKATELDLSELNQVLLSIAPDQELRRRAVRFDAIVGKVLLFYKRAVAVAFKSTDGKRMSIAFAIDDIESPEHEEAYARAPESRRSRIFGAMFDADRRRREIQIAVREMKDDLPKLSSSRIDALQVAGASQTLASREEVSRRAPINVRTISVYEHPPLLRSAFDSAKSRILIISPWIRSDVVDGDFVKRLIGCLERNVEVTIGFGIAARDARERDSDRHARESLLALSKTHRNFKFVNKGDTHAKVLLVDSNFFVTTSFNWLSFRGDPDRPMREEEGTLVEDAKLVDEYFTRLVARFRDRNEPR